MCVCLSDFCKLTSDETSSQHLPYFPSITWHFTAGHPDVGTFCVQLANEHLVRRGRESSPCYACVFTWIINNINTGGAGALLLSQSGSTNTTQSGSTRYLPSSLPQMKAASKTTANINCTFKQTKEFLINRRLWTYCTSLSLQLHYTMQKKEIKVNMVMK